MYDCQFESIINVSHPEPVILSLMTGLYWKYVKINIYK